MKISLNIFLVLVFLLSFVSCEKNGIFGLDEEDIVLSDFTENFGELVERDFIGSVFDKNGLPLSGVSVEIGGQTAITDSNGIFILKDASVYTYFAYIKARKDAFQNASTTIIPTDGVNKVRLIMLNSSSTQTINSGSESTVNLLDGTSIKFDGNFINRDSIAYSGLLNVSLTYYDPADSDFSQKLPGMPYGQSRYGDERIMESYGAVSVELNGIDGTPLYLAKDSPAEVTIPINSQLQSTALPSIPLWYFDVTDGYWREDGTADKRGNVYMGSVTHLSHWNFSTSKNMVNLNLLLNDEDDNAIANQRINVTNTNSNYPFNTRLFYTNSDGSFNCIATANSQMEFDVYNSATCGVNLIESVAVNTSTTDQNTDITISNSTSAITATLSGKSNNCSEYPVQNGYVLLSLEGEIYFDVIVDGVYQINMLHCEAETTFMAQSINYENAQKSPQINYLFNDPITYLGETLACNSVYEIIQYTIDDGTEKFLLTDSINATFIPLNVGYNAPSISVFETGTSNSRFKLFGLLDEAPYFGKYGNWVIGDPTNIGLNIGQVIDISDTNNSITYSVVEIGHIDQYIDIHFQGNYEDASGIPHSIVGIIHVSRDY